MGNSLGCSASGERLVSAARDGDGDEARMLLQFNPCLAKYSTFGGLNTPLHFAAAKGHIEIVTMLLENGADVNSRNYCGQTALMQACGHGHWEVVQTLLLYRSNVTRADYLTGRTALHFAAVGGHVRCVRLLVADFVPSVPYGEMSCSPLECSALARFINKQADGGITALHMAALNGYTECVLLLLDLRASVSVATFHYGSSMNLIGAGSTPLHYAACGGNLKCCQMLLARGASRLTLNCSGWLPVDVAKIWGRHELVPLLNPNSDMTKPTFPPSSYLSLPLMSILNIARECGVQSPTTNSEESDICSVCLERVCNVAAEGCAHELCVQCALYLCSTGNVPSSRGPPGSVPCPLCRNGIISFTKLPSTPAKELKPSLSLSLCHPCVLPPRSLGPPPTDCRSEFRRARAASVSTELTCPITCSPFPSVAAPSCTCDDDPCECVEPQGDVQEQSPRPSHSTVSEMEIEEQRPEKTSCSGMFWNRRSCHREHQCNAEINA